MSPERKFYVYIHRRKTDGRIFYVGKGVKSRARSKVSRSKFWHATVNKYGFRAEIKYGPMPEACAFSLEVALIYAIGFDNLCNLSTGGTGGMSGYKFDKQTVARKAKKCMKPVINSDGDIFPSMRDAVSKMREIGHHKATESHISSCCNGRRHTSYGLSWSFDISNVPQLIDHVKKVNENRTVSVIASNGMIFPSVSSAAAWLNSIGNGSGTSVVSRCCKNPGRKCAGLEWRYYHV